MKEALQISKTNALKAFNKAGADGKKLLSDLFGKDIFNQKITDRVKTFEDACLVNETTPDEVIPFPNPKTSEQKALNGCAKLMQIVKALNEGWEPDWSDKSQRKYYSWFTYRSSGVGFSYYVYVCWIRLRLSAPGFALKRLTWLSMQGNSLRTYTKMFFY